MNPIDYTIGVFRSGSKWWQWTIKKGGRILASAEVRGQREDAARDANAMLAQLMAQDRERAA